MFWVLGLQVAHPFTSLDDLDAKYDLLLEKYPGKYSWYQFVLDQPVMEVYAEQGVGFLEKLRIAFPCGTKKLTSDEVLDRLETISLGWEV